MATFNATTQIFNYMDTVVSQFVASNLANIISYAAPIVGIGLTMALMIEGLFLMGRPNGEPLSTLVNRFVKYAIVISIASVGGWYQTTLANAAMKVPDEFASVFIINGQSGSATQNTIVSTIDQAIDNGLTTAKTAFTNASVFSGGGLTELVLGIAVLICTVLMCGIGAGLILMAKVMLGIVVCFGPVFIFLLLFESTAALFTKWVGSVINYGLVTVLFSAVFGLMISFFNKAIAAAASANPDAPILVAIVTCGLICVITYYVIKEVPHMANSWGQGVSADIFRHMRQSRESGGAGGAGGGRSGNSGGAGGRGAQSGGGAGSQGAASPAQSAANATPAGQVAQAATNGFARGSRR
ncbi:hypothetical protein WT34_24370 [Burkholderia stagnalis]|uniref:type IV secretion system protein n=1 Tax=Burkholderia stagnalis TaxID=1503054 RepID=UPI0007573736|nr:type IV secretion system protein [Burkholderia stagnalis]KVX69114.1 hypothetical protein WT34_24370 [Burkholderia stagnalis]